MMRDCAVQISPWSIATLQPMMPGTAFSTSTSSSMIAADLPPSSSVARRMSRPHSSAIRLPTGVLPVKLTLSTPRVGDQALALRGVGDEHVDHARRQAGLLDGLGEDVAGEARSGPAP